MSVAWKLISFRNKQAWADNISLQNIKIAVSKQVILVCFVCVYDLNNKGIVTEYNLDGPGGKENYTCSI